MHNITDAVVYFLKNNPAKNRNTISWIMMFLYLSEWLFCLRNKERAFQVDWIIGRYGPFSHQVHESIKNSSDVFFINETSNNFGHRKDEVSLREHHESIENRENKITEIYQYVFNKTKDYSWNDMAYLIQSTYPFVNGNQTTSIDILNQAFEYIEIIKKYTQKRANN